MSNIGFGDGAGPSARPSMLHVTRRFSSAEILALATPAIVVPRPGAGLAIVLMQSMLTLNFATTPYTASGAPSFSWSNNPTVSFAQFNNNPVNVISGTQTASSTIRQYASSSFVDNANADLLFYLPFAATGGDSTMSLDVYYTVVVRP